MPLLSRSEELVLLAVWHLQQNAYGVAIRRYLCEVTGEDWSVGGVYVPLDKMTKSGFLKDIQADPTPERGGRSKRYYSLTPQGIRALEAVRRVQQKVWAGVPTVQWGTDPA